MPVLSNPRHENPHVVRVRRRLELQLRIKRLEDTIRLARSDMAWCRAQIAELDNEIADKAA